MNLIGVQPPCPSSKRRVSGAAGAKAAAAAAAAAPASASASAATATATATATAAAAAVPARSPSSYSSSSFSLTTSGGSQASSGSRRRGSKAPKLLVVPPVDGAAIVSFSGLLSAIWDIKYRYEVHMSINMLDRWEKVILHTAIFAVLAILAAVVGLSSRMAAGLIHI